MHLEPWIKISKYNNKQENFKNLNEHQFPFHTLNENNKTEFLCCCSLLKSLHIIIHLQIWVGHPTFQSSGASVSTVWTVLVTKWVGQELGGVALSLRQRAGAVTRGAQRWLSWFKVQPVRTEWGRFGRRRQADGENIRVDGGTGVAGERHSSCVRQWRLIQIFSLYLRFFFFLVWLCIYCGYCIHKYI